MSSRTRSSAQLQLLDGGVVASSEASSHHPAYGSPADWVLDERTRRVGLQGVAQAKAILSQVSPPEPVDGHRRAS